MALQFPGKYWASQDESDSDCEDLGDADELAARSQAALEKQALEKYGAALSQGDRGSFSLQVFDLKPGLVFQKEMLHKFRSSVHHPSSSLRGAFFMLAIFRRYTFQLSEQSVGHALHSVLGGAPDGFHVLQESPRHFRFAVASKDVGLFIASKRRIVAESFDVYFHLWRDGGPNWTKELKKWQQEEDSQWTLVTSKKKKKKKKSFVKSVIFNEQIELPSPEIKSRPNHNQAAPIKPVIAPSTFAIRIGSVLCPLDSGTKSQVSSAINDDNSNQGPLIVLKQQQVAQTSSCLPNPCFQIPNSGAVVVDGTVAAHNSTSHLPSPQFPKGNQSTPTGHHEPTSAWLQHSARTSQSAHTSHHLPKRSKCCYRCLSPRHLIRFCRGRIRCRFCYRQGHIEKQCYTKQAINRDVWRPKPQSKMQLNSAVHPSRENRELELTREQKPHFNPESVDKPLPAPNSSSPPPAPPNTATQDTPPHAKATLMTNFPAPQHDPEGDKMANLVEQNKWPT